MKNTGTTQAWHWLTAPIAVLLVIAAMSGLLFGTGLYAQGEPFLLAQGIGQDIVSLAVALPGLIVSALYSRRGSKRAQLIWLGILGYLAYTYALFSFDIHFNWLFLVYVGLFGCSLYALISGIAAIDSVEIKARFGEKTPVKVVSVFLAVVVVLFYFLWIREVGSASVAGNIPERAKDWDAPTYGVHVLDMAVLLPAVGLTAVWLWQQRPLGYTLTGMLLVLLLVLGTALVAMKVSEMCAGFPIPTGRFLIYGVFTAIGLGISVWYLRGLQEA